jgi:lipopolysaccharide/colanic/teichoic acid biosynthesis glycosyltransferase
MSTSISESLRFGRNPGPLRVTERPRAVASNQEILSEKTFQNLLRLERKRVERSGRRFVLMLLEPGSLVRDPAKRPFFNKLLATLLQSIRETDLRGWYEDEAIFGVIFTEICESGCGEVLQALLAKIGKALSSALSAEQINEIRLSFHIFPEPSGADGSGGQPNFVFYRDLVRDLERGGGYFFLKRSIDVVGSLCGLALLFPLLLAIAAAIRLTSKGPILFRQERIGQFCKKFTFLKFRSMYLNNDPSIHREYVERLISGNSKNLGMAGNVFKITNDPRVTPIGRFLRRTSLDELPQLFNVLRGDMTLVGPRPCIAYEFNKYQVWHRQRLLAVKPGITGLWQVTGRSAVKFDEMVRLDLAYANARSLRLDLKILWQTPRAVISGSGAY